MRSKRILNEVIAAKQKVNLLNTCDLDLSALGQIDPSNIINSNIYIKEALNFEAFNAFQSLKTIAKGLGFKYTWHRKVTFLTRWSDGDSAHVFASEADLSAIALSYKRTSSDKISTSKRD